MVFVSKKYLFCFWDISIFYLFWEPFFASLVGIIWGDADADFSPANFNEEPTFPCAVVFSLFGLEIKTMNICDFGAFKAFILFLRNKRERIEEASLPKF